MEKREHSSERYGVLMVNVVLDASKINDDYFNKVDEIVAVTFSYMDLLAGCTMLPGQKDMPINPNSLVAHVIVDMGMVHDFYTPDDLSNYYLNLIMEKVEQYLTDNGLLFVNMINIRLPDGTILFYGGEETNKNTVDNKPVILKQYEHNFNKFVKKTGFTMCNSIL